MARFGVTVTYIATHHYVIEAKDFDEAQEIGEEMSLDEAAHDHSLYDVTARQIDSDEGPVDNED